MELGIKEIAALAAVFVSGYALAWNRRAKGLEQVFSISNWLLTRRKWFEHCLKLKDKPFETWSDEDKEAAAEVCAAFHLAGIMSKEKAVSGELITKIFYYSLTNTFEVLKPYLRWVRDDLERGGSYWIGFDLLVKLHRSNQVPGYRSSSERLDLEPRKS